MAVLNIFEAAVENSTKSSGSSEGKMGPQWIRFEFSGSAEGVR